MVRSSGSATCKLAKVQRMLDILLDHLTLGKDEWERAASKYNARHREGWEESDYDSPRPKFKQLYAAKKPTGDPYMPPHILTAKDMRPRLS